MSFSALQQYIIKKCEMKRGRGNKKCQCLNDMEETKKKNKKTFILYKMPYRILLKLIETIVATLIT